MKIGILTFHRAENFGAALQVYALSEFLKSIGHNPQIIDYRCKAIEHQYDVLSPYLLFSKKNIFSSIVQYFKRISQAHSRYSKKKIFKEFRCKYLDISKPYYKIIEDLGYDAYIAGSDQIWNPGLTGGFNNYYFLNFPMNPNARKISYAASSEKVNSYSLFNFKDQVSSCLSNFDAISVREEVFKNELQKYTSKQISTCLDPTFLVPPSKYRELATFPQIKNYILVYHMFFSKESCQLAQRISKTTGKQIVEVFAKGVTKYDNTKHIQIAAFDPCTLLGLIINADTIITTSFHGLALSLILQKEVWVMNTSANSRLKNLLKNFGLENRLLSEVESYSVKNVIDYNQISGIINEKIASSKEFILKALYS